MKRHENVESLYHLSNVTLTTR